MCITTFIVRTCAKCSKEISRLQQETVSCKRASQTDPKCFGKIEDYRFFKKLCSYCHPSCSCFSDEALNKILGSDWDFSSADKLQDDHVHAPTPEGNDTLEDEVERMCHCVKKMRLSADGRTK
ncbi:hypothetical protein CSAL01_05200 [Colletotrichum salicis]|uniref:Uncharacterized protein n=1 Tax=Colletotrichum salicis TaxID=1209931 RepID=A0A135T5H7_9PEZI|nr:hypothetical protein CSAL01_05200 [Colletotrichum salicis]